MHSPGIRFIAAVFILACMGAAFAQSKTTIYTYDALGRLTFVEDSQNGNRDYDYDAAGNRLKVAVGPATDAASEPASPNPIYVPGEDPLVRVIPAMPVGLFKNLIADCAWRASWKLTSGATFYSYKSTTGRTSTIYPVNSNGGTSVQVSGTTIAVTTTCPTGNPQSNEPGSVKACNADGCSDAASF